MHLHRFFACPPYCHARIYIPLATPPDSSRSRIPWPAGAVEQIFLCPLCSRAKAYTREHFHLDPTPSTVSPDICTDEAIYRLSFPCGIDKCEGLIEIHAVMPKGPNAADAVNLAAKIVLSDVPCNKVGHRHSERGIEASFLGFSIADEWMALSMPS